MNPTIIERPLVIMFENEHGEGRLLECHLYPPADYTYEHYGLVIADLIGHVADHYKVSKEDVLEWVQKEIDRPTTKLEGGRVQ